MAREFLDQAPRNARREQGVTCGDDTDSGEQIFRQGTLEQKAACSGPQRRIHVVVQVECRENKDADAAGLGGARDPAGRLDPVEHGHPDVHQDDVRVGAPRGADRFRAVRGLAGHGEAGGRGDDPAQTGPDKCLVVGHDHAKRHRVPSARGRRAVTRKPCPGRGAALNSPR